MADIVSQLRSVTQASFPSEKDRKAAIAETWALLTRLETPWESGFRYAWMDPARMACLRIAMQLDLFKKWKADGGAPKSGEDLQKLVSCDPTFFVRILSHLAATNMLEVVGPEVYGLTPFTSSLAEQPIANTVNYYIDLSGPVNMNLPTFMASVNYQNPLDAANSNFTHRFGAPLWEWLKTHPRDEATMGGIMATYAANRPPLSEVYPTYQLLGQANKDEGVLLVDIGGGEGHDAMSFARAHPQKPGKIVLQDRPELLQNLTPVDPTIQKMEYDFFTPQPVKNAAAYYFHFVLHDWPDGDCIKILNNQKVAMTKGYSKLLIHEIVLDPTAPDATRTATDMTMMAIVSGKERTNKEWVSLLDSAGFKINRIYTQPRATESVIEAEPA